MKLRTTLIFLAAALQFLLPLPSSGQSVDLGGMISLLSSARFDARFEPVAIFRFIPEVKFSLFSRRGVTVDAEASPKKGTQLMNVKHYSRLTTIIFPGSVKHLYLSSKS